MSGEPFITISFMPREDGQGVVVWAKQGDKPAYILNWYSFRFPTNDAEPGTVAFSRSKRSLKEWGPVKP